MDYTFRETTANPERFFAILPPDWRAAIAPRWEHYQGTARIYTLESDEEILGGGILFATPAPDILAYGEEAQRWFDQGYLYIGFLWVKEVYRGRRLGRAWLQELRERLPGQKFWLTIDDYGLRPFYERNGFRLVKKVELANWPEWIMAG